MENIDWSDLQLFLAVAKEGGLSAAAKHTHKSPATLGRRMHALERSLGKELFIRHDRGYELLTDGKVLLDKLTEIEVEILDLLATGSRQDKPLVKISAGTWTTLYLIQNVDKFSGSLDQALIRFISTEKVLDISHREVVIGIRNRRPMDDNLVCRRLKQVEFAPYASPQAPELWIKVQADIPSSQWLQRHISSNAIDDLRVCEVSVPRNSLDLALQGRGIALLPTFIGDAQPELQRVGEVIEELSHDSWLVTHQEDRYLPEVRKLITLLGKVLSD